jgi:hypothetical protein
MRNGSEAPTLFPEELVIVFPDSSNKYYRDCDVVIRKIIKNIPLTNEEKSFFKRKSAPADAKKADIVSSIMANDPNTRDTQGGIMNDDNSAQFPNRIFFILMVSADREDFDVFSLKDFFLIWQKYLKTDSPYTGTGKTRDNIDIILVINGTNDALYHKVSNLFAFAIKYDSKLYDSMFYIGYHGGVRPQRLISKYDHKAQSVFPLIPIDHEIRQELDEPLWRYYESYDSLQKALEDPKDEKVSLVDFILAAIHHIFDKDARARQEYDNIKQLSLLQLIVSSFYIQIQDYVADNIMDLLEVTDTQSNAIRQLIENIVFHSSYQVGVLLVRSYNTDNKGEGEYSHLSRYGGYFHNQRRDAKRPYYEVCIEDASDQSIMDNFIEKLPSRLTHFAVSRDAITDLVDLAKKELKNVQGFFERDFNVQNSFWNRYASITKVAYHQGLLLFENNVKMADGYFEVISASDEDNAFDLGHKYASIKVEEDMLPCDELPGTKIRALYPLQKRTKQYSQLINIKEALIIKPDSYRAIPIEFGEKSSENNVVSQSDKERLGAELFDQLLQKLQGEMSSIRNRISKDTTVVFDIILSSDDDSIREAVIKHFGVLFTQQSLIGAGSNLEKRFAYAIRFKKESDIVACVNTFKLMYLIYCDKLNRSLPALEIFLYDEAGHLQILWYGNSLQSVLSVDKTRTFYYGSDSFLEALLSDVTSEKEQHIPQLEDFLPFPVILKDADDKTLFAKNLEYILKNDIMGGSKQGYKICNTHMRLGSKIHIADFFQAEVIFQNSYFIKNFSYLIAKSIRERIPPDNENARPLVLLLGYGTYSELLMYSIKQFFNLEKNGYAAYDCEYKIYDPTKDLKNDLRMFKDLHRDLLTAWRNHYESIYVFQIVPVNTTLTTFSKIFDAFFVPCVELKISNIIKLINNYALIIIRDSGEPEPGCFETLREQAYFCQPKEKEKTLETSAALTLPSQQKMYKKDNERYHVDYFVSVKTLWYEPKKCEKCYPGNLIDEAPLVETNKVSVIPALQYGGRKLYGEHPRDDVIEGYKALEEKLIQTFFSYKETSCTLGTLSEAFLEYGHIVQDNNHFQFYFYTHKIFDHIHNGPQSQKFDAWLKELRKSISGSETAKNICNIIISPLHSTNTGFLSEVSDKVFSDKAIILHTEIDKDFKDTFQSKYLFISNQISSAVNLAERFGEEYTFNFFYVDDTVYGGSTFFRAKSLANALIVHSSFSEKDTPKVHINIFRKVILLVSRLSENSKALYVKDPGSSFYSYINVPISALRSHGDACVLCNIVKDGFEISKRSATIDIAEKWYSRAISRLPVKADALENDEDLKNKKELENKEKTKKTYLRFLAACRAHSLLNKCNDTKEAYETIVFLIKYSKEQDEVNAYKWLLSFLKVLSRPFLSFRKSTREAVFTLLLKLTEKSLDRPSDNDKEIQELFEMVPLSEEADFIYLLIKRLSKMGSNYMLRCGVYSDITKRLEYLEHREHREHLKRFSGFDTDFIMGAKQIIESSGDETKSMWLESLLIRKKEPNDDELGDAGKKDPVYSANLDLSLYIENTRIMYEGIRKLFDIKSKLGKDSRFSPANLEIYYLKYFIEMLELNGIKKDERAPEICDCMAKLYRMLRATHDHSFGESPIEFYESLCLEFKTLSNADRVDMFGASKKKKDKSVKYQIASSCDKNPLDPGKVLSFLDKFPDHLTLPSFYIEPQDGDKIIAYCVFNGITLSEKDAKKSYEKQRLNLSEEDSLPQLTDTVVVMLSYSNSETKNIPKIGNIPLNVAFGLRAVLVFRHDLVKRLAVDFQNNMFQMRRVHENFRAQIRKARSWGHTDDRELIELTHQLAGCSGEEDKYRIDTLKLLINIYIGRLNIRLLQADVDNNDPDIRKTKTGINLQPFFGYPVFGESKMVDNLLRMLHSEKRFKIIYEKKISDNEYCLPDAVHKWPVRLCGSDNMVLFYIEMLMILLNIINSALKFGDMNGEDYLEIDISTCPDVSHTFYWLEITNRLDSLDVEGVEERVHNCLRREPDADGISLAVIYEYMKNAYGEEGIDELSFVEVDKTAQRFKVRLPILGMPIEKKDGG